MDPLSPLSELPTSNTKCQNPPVSKARDYFETLGFKNERKRHLPHSKWCILGSHFTRPHLLTFSQALSYLYTLLPSANPCATKLLRKWGKILLGWHTQLQKHKSHKSEKALCSCGFAFMCPSGTASMGGSVTACASVGTWQAAQKILGGHEGTWPWFYSFPLTWMKSFLSFKEKTWITKWFG